MVLKKLDALSFEEVIYDNNEACLVIFSRKDCHVCREVIPMIEELLPKYKNRLGFYYVDVEENKDLYKRFSLKGVPQILFFNNGEYQGKLVGQVEEKDVEVKIAEIL